MVFHPVFGEKYNTVDDIEVREVKSTGFASALMNASKFALHGNYPNPFNPLARLFPSVE